MTALRAAQLKTLDSGSGPGVAIGAFAVYSSPPPPRPLSATKAAVAPAAIPATAGIQSLLVRFLAGSIKDSGLRLPPEWRLTPPRLKPPFTVQQTRGVDAGGVGGKIQTEVEIAGGFADGESRALLIRGLALDVARAGEADQHGRRLPFHAAAVAIETRIRRDGNHVKRGIDGALFVSATLTATGRSADKG